MKRAASFSIASARNDPLRIRNYVSTKSVIRMDCASAKRSCLFPIHLSCRMIAPASASAFDANPAVLYHFVSISNLSERSGIRLLFLMHGRAQRGRLFRTLSCRCWPLSRRCCAPSFSFRSSRCLLPVGVGEDLQEKSPTLTLGRSRWKRRPARGWHRRSMPAAVCSQAGRIVLLRVTSAVPHSFPDC